ncbi:MAG: hypothetical protein P8Y18_08550 [Candidatus Bathyarchaeota archaeon]
MPKVVKEDTIKCQVDLMEKEIVYFQCLKRNKARRTYLRLLLANKDQFGLNEPIYLKRR